MKTEQPSKGNLLIRYLLIPFYVITPFVLQNITIYLFVFIYNFFVGINFGTLLILIFLGIISVGLGFWILIGIFTLISMAGFFIMGLTPNKGVFWGSTIIGILLILFIFILNAVYTQYYVTIGEERFKTTPTWIVALITTYVLTAYLYGGFNKTQEGGKGR